jgi:HK97 family phage prohead protease
MGETMMLEVCDQRLPDARYWTRSSDTPAELDVSFPDRMVEVVVMPYETGAQVPWGRERREVTEVIDRGAFDGIERRPNRIKANRDHDETRTFGKAVTLHPSRREGLVAKLQVARTPLGDETLELAAGGYLDVSAGFKVKPGDLQWEGRSRYHVTKAWLRHIALVPEGAYGENASILAVRAQPTLIAPPADAVAMPRLSGYLRDQQLAEYRAQEAAMDARWRVHPPGR